MIGSIATVVGFVIATIVSLEALLVSPGRQHLFAWHPFLMSMGALGLSTAGIQAVRSRWGTKGIQSKTRRVQFHSALSNGGLLFMLGGQYAIYTNKERMGKPHFTSWHSYFGLLTLALWAANVAVAGTNTVDFSNKRLVFLWRSWSHRWLGAAAYTLGLVAVSLGLHSGWGVGSFGVRGAWAMTLSIGAIFLGIISQGLGVIPVAEKKDVR
ncbi:unnamed protein product [Ascophyllum nodosum]